MSSVVPNELTSDLVMRAWRFMSCLYGTKIVSKKDSSFMKLVAFFLNFLGIQKKELFMSKYTTTIGKTIYVPFEVGNEKDLDLYSQIVICAHEHQHVVQYERLWAIPFICKYLLSKEGRTRLEAEAYRSSIELSWFYFRETPEPKQIASILLNYGLQQKHVDIATEVLEDAVVEVKRGLLLNDATKAIITLL